MTSIIKIMPKWSARAISSTDSNPPLIAVLAYEGVNAFELGMAIEVFSLTNLNQTCYEVAVCAEYPGTPLSAGMVSVVANAGMDVLRRATTVVVPGWLDIDVEPPATLLAELRRAHRNGCRLVSICSGVFLLAAAGLLDGRHAAVHWAQATILAERYPRIKVDPNVLYVDEKDILSSAGRAAGLDLCLHIIRKDHGGAIARSVAQRMVIPAHRDGGQAQYIPQSAQTQIDGLADLCAWLSNNLGRKLGIDEMSARSRMSRRTFIRRFETATGLPPGEWLTRERIERARSLLEDTTMPVEHIAVQVGFGSPEALRHHFQKRFRTSPMRYRNSFHSAHSVAARIDGASYPSGESRLAEK